MGEEEDKGPAPIDNQPPPRLLRTRVGIMPITNLPSWAFLLGMVGLIVILWAITLTGPGNFVDEQIWGPIVTDEGYNPVNTVLLMVVLALVLGWVYRLLSELHESVDLELFVAVVPYLVWGSVFRVLEDSDLFAPFGEEVRAATGGDTPMGASCVDNVGGTFLHQCFGVFFITPIIYVMVTFIAIGLFWVGHKAKAVSERANAKAGLRYVGLSMVAVFALYCALWASDQTFIRFVANPAVALGALAVAYFIVWRDTVRRGTVNARWVMFAYGIAWLIVGLYYVFVWMVGGRAGWAPTDPVNWWVLVALVVAPLVVAYSSARKGRILSGDPRVSDRFGERSKEPGSKVGLLIALVVVDGIAIFLSILAFHSIESRLDAGTLFDDPLGLVGLILQLIVGPVVFVLSSGVALSAARGRMGIHPALLFFADPINLIMIYGQASDGLMTSLGIDVFGYHEKHVLPGFLIERVDALDLPAPWGAYPTAMVMIPIKILIVLAVVWIIDIGSRDEVAGRRNLVGLVKMSIAMVGLSPGVRDGVRLAMGT
jgi:uncharacterized membrane protein